MKPAKFDYLRPNSLEAALAALAASESMAKPISGGQSLGPMMNMRLAQPDQLIDLSILEALSVCESSADSVTFGANITHAQIEDGHVPDPSGGLMCSVASAIAYRAIRNRGTLGGSLVHADPAADWINLMPLLQATLLVASAKGTRQISAQNWMLGAFTPSLNEDEILVSVTIPKLSSQARRSYYKINRKPGEFSQATAGFVQDPQRQICAAVIGAIDGAPHYLANAQGLITELQDHGLGPLAHAALTEAGLKLGEHSFDLHGVALLRAAAQLKSDHGAMQ